ncbi:hypothetical protein G7B40_010670 [Aetokthonos hydrillicola Thurmond2011]|jgi:hypothetical protein|uniref:Uncharacterized protein n=2 Tax=Aetokthonos TaxID=1550243 RepID=A0AAP5M4P8_9CYAN|nr:hypothetical protein [Aetokthonos hydrillicola Thurmond2011]
MVLRLYHVLLGCALLVLVPLGVKLVHPHTSSTNNLRRTPLTQAYAKNIEVTDTSITPGYSEGNIWKNILGKTDVPPNWKVAPCKERTPLLCVSSNQKRLGTIEMGVYPLGQQLDFQKILVKTGIPLNSKVDYQSSKYQTQVSVALKAWIAQHYQDFLQDNRVINGNSIALKPTSMQQVSVGKLSGVRYGFIGRKQKGEVYEQHLGYVACDGTALYVISTAFNPALDTGKFETLENFERFQPHLSTIVANLRLPR